jgi:hypothetical protein
MPKRKYTRGKNPKSHKGGPRVSNYERGVLGTSTHSKTAQRTYFPFDWKAFEEEMEKFEKKHPYGMLYLTFNCLFPGEPKQLYDSEKAKGKQIRVFWEIERFKDLSDWKEKFEAMKETKLQGGTLQYEHEYLPWIIDLQTYELVCKPDQDITGFKPKDSPTCEEDESYYVENWAHEYLQKRGAY